MISWSRGIKGQFEWRHRPESSPRSSSRCRSAGPRACDRLDPMANLDGTGDLQERRSRLKDLGEAARALDARPGDADAARTILAFPLMRKDWEGLGPDIDDELAELTPFVGAALRTLGRSEDAAPWYEAALEPCERAM